MILWQYVHEYGQPRVASSGTTPCAMDSPMVVRYFRRSIRDRSTKGNPSKSEIAGLAGPRRSFDPREVQSPSDGSGLTIAPDSLALLCVIGYPLFPLLATSLGALPVPQLLHLLLALHPARLPCLSC